MAASVLPAAVIRQIQHNVLYGAVLALDLIICIEQTKIKFKDSFML